MRTRDEIENTTIFDEHNGIYRGANEAGRETIDSLQLEVLLDIRDLLTDSKKAGNKTSI